MKEELSYAYVHTLAARAGFSCDRPTKDFQSMDVQVNSEGLVREDSLLQQAHLGLQLKATVRDFSDGENAFSFPLPMKNYNDLRCLNAIPRLLVVFVMPSAPDKWIEHSHEHHLLSRKCAYFLNLFGQPETTNETSKTVYIPRQNVLSVESLTDLMYKASRLELQDVS